MSLHRIWPEILDLEIFSMMGKVIIILMGQLLSLEEYYAWHTMRSQKNIISWKKMDAAKKYVEKESKKSK